MNTIQKHNAPQQVKTIPNTVSSCPSVKEVWLQNVWDDNFTEVWGY
jgi:hypothetical protein